MEYIMSNICQLNTLSSYAKTYKTCESAQKAFDKFYGDYDVSYLVVQLNSNNCNNPKHYGRFVPVAIGEKAIALGIHLNFHVVG